MRLLTLRYYISCRFRERNVQTYLSTYYHEPHHSSSESDFQGVMDFDSLVGTAAYLAKQLELRWFYHWELPDWRDRSPTSAVMNCTSSEAAGNCQALQQMTPWAGRLVRKRHHSMPFLRRNTHNAHGDGRSRTFRRSTNARGDSAMTVAPNNSARAEARPKKTSIKRVDESNYPKENKRLRVETTAPSPAVLPITQSMQSSPSLSTAFQSYIESPTVRQKVLNKIPKEMHHDETFVLERMKESWLDNIDSATPDIEGFEAESCEIAHANEVKDRPRSRGYSIMDSRSLDYSSRVLLMAYENSNVSIMLPPGVVLPGLHDTEDRLRLESNTERSRTHLPPAFFHYIFMQPNNVHATIVEEIDGRVCPLCNFDGKSNEGLLSHCGTYHGTLLKANDSNSPIALRGNEGCAIFEALMGEEGQLHVVVRVVPLLSSHTLASDRVHDNFVFIQPKRRRALPKHPVTAFEMRRGRRDERRKDKLMNGRSSYKSSTAKMTIPFIQRRHDKAATLDAGSRNKRLLALQASNAPASIISAYLPSDTVPMRQYFHSRTNLPMSHGEWMVDSDDEIDETWLHEMSSELLDELEDVSPKEKQFMKLWNRFIKSNHLIADRDMPEKCNEFIVIHRKQLLNAGLRLNLLLHLFNLWDSGVISSNRIFHCMSMFDAGENNDT